MTKLTLFLAFLCCVVHCGVSDIIPMSKFENRKVNSGEGTLREVSIDHVTCPSDDFCTVSTASQISGTVKINVPPTRNSRKWKAYFHVWFGGQHRQVLVRNLHRSVGQRSLCKTLTEGSCNSRSRQNMTFSYSSYLGGLRGLFTLEIGLKDGSKTILCRSLIVRLQI